MDPVPLPTGYTLKAVHAIGAHGLVLCALDPCGIERAIKTRGSGGQFPADLFRREMAIQASLDIPGAVPVLHSWSDSSGDGMVLPWLPIRLSELTPLPAHELIAIFELLAQTVVGLNWSGVAHRDITPDNILFVDTSARQPWLADFGMAVHIGSPIHVAPAIRCTKGYAWLDSPSPTDPRQDSFALAVSMWFALTGALPPTKPTSASLRKLARQRGVSVPRAWISRFARWLTHPPQPPSLLAEVRHMHVLFINGSRPNQLRSILTSVVFWTAIASVLAVAAYTFWAIS